MLFFKNINLLHQVIFLWLDLLIKLPELNLDLIMLSLEFFKIFVFIRELLFVISEIFFS